IKEEGRNLIRDMFATDKLSLETNQLEQLINSFNEAIKGGQSTVNSQNPGFEQKFNRKFWMLLEMPATLATEDVVSVRSDPTRKFSK
ncbi:2485_t:CDS:2, partial [Ambispora gerdemannii]